MMDRNWSVLASIMLAVFILFGCLSAGVADDNANVDVKEKIVKDAEVDDSATETRQLSDLQVEFLNCSIGCDSAIRDGSLFQCLQKCQDGTRIPADEITKVLTLRTGGGLTEDECRKELGFVCPLDSGGCCCSSVLDCKELEKLVVGCTVTSCSAKKGGGEICTCKF